LLHAGERFSLLKSLFAIYLGLAVTGLALFIALGLLGR
jgi:hypothetical protein